MKGILLCGGLGSRLYPTTLGTSKQLVPVYDKPVVYYPLAVLMQANIQDILVISSPQDLPNIIRLLGNGNQFGVNLSYAEQLEPKGIADAFNIARPIFGDQQVCLILGDNLFAGHGLNSLLGQVELPGATIFGYHVHDPERYGVVQFDELGKPLKILEKPKVPPSNWVVTGLYFYDSQVWEMAAQLQPSARGELEITDINQLYLEKGQCQVLKLGPGFAWLDTGTPESLLQASNYVQMIQHRQGLQIACLEVIAYEKGWINESQLAEAAQRFSKTEYGRFIQFKINEPSK